MVSLYLPASSKIGSGYQAHLLANALSDRGHQIDMYSPHGSQPGSRYRVVGVGTGARFRTFQFAAALRGLDFLQYDVIHAHGDDYLLVGKPRPPHIRTMHGTCLAEAVHIRGPKERVRMAALGVSEILSSALVSDETVAVSRNTTRWYPWIRHVIPNAVDLRRFSPGGRKSDCPSVLFVGTLRQRKRGQLLVDTFAHRVRSEFPNAELWMVSDAGLPSPGVTYFGSVSDAGLIDLYQRAWVFCLPSKYEGFGVPYIEAMACGTPVVATPNPGAKEVLDHGRYGLLTSEKELGSMLVSLLRSPERMGHFCEAGLQRSLEFSLDRIAARYEQLYTGAIESSRRSRHNVNLR